LENKSGKTMNNIGLNFLGPFTFTGARDSVFQSAYAKSSGIYLWTIKQHRDNTHMIHYVGETVSFAKRHREHLIQILGLNYGIFNAEKAQRGVCELIWNGLWREKSSDAPLKLIEAYKTIQADVMHYVSIINIFFAELAIDDFMRKHIEGCIGWNLRNNNPEAKALYPDDNHVGTVDKKNNGELLIRATEHIQGLDLRIMY
jgi:hypothetical protein